MKFNVASKAFYSHAQAVSKVINAKNALTILNNFLITLDGNTLTITGSDVENAITSRLEVAEAEGSGSFCIDARRLVDLLKEMPDQGLTFTINDETYEVAISYLSGNYELVALPGEEYPEYSKEESDTEPIVFDCPAEQILKGIDNTLFAVGTDEFRPMMMGIYFDIKPDNITFVATDTRKLVRYKNSMSAPGVTGSCIMPVKPATVIKNVFAKDETLHIVMTQKSATISSSNIEFNCRFIKNNFPDYTKVIPENSPLTLTVDRVSLLNAVRRVGVFVDPGFGLEKFKITPDNILIKSNDQNMCTMAREQVPCNFSGTELIIGFSAPFLIDICSTLSTDEVVVNLTDPGRPGVFRPAEQDEDSDLLMLLMPMTVNEF